MRKSSSAKSAFSSSIRGAQTVRSSSRKGMGTSRQMVVSRLASSSFSPQAAIRSPVLPAMSPAWSRMFFRRAPRLHQFARALLADAGHARNVVRRVAPQREDVAHEHRIGNAVLGLDGRTVHHLDAVALLLIDAAAVVHQLPVILVGRDHVDLIPGRGALAGKGADHIVGFVPGDFEHGNAHGVEHPLHVGHRQQDVLGRLRAVGLVFGVDRAAERAAFWGRTPRPAGRDARASGCRAGTS